MPAIICPNGVYGAIPEEDICNECTYLRITRNMTFTCDWYPGLPSCGNCRHITYHDETHVCCIHSPEATLRTDSCKHYQA